MDQMNPKEELLFTCDLSYHWVKNPKIPMLTSKSVNFQWINFVVSALPRPQYNSCNPISLCSLKKCHLCRLLVSSQRVRISSHVVCV